MPASRPTSLRHGFSLVELLVASTLSLLLMGAIVALFVEFTTSVSDGQAMSELTTHLRNAAWRLRQDLAGLTCVPATRVPFEANAGYFHVTEGSNDPAPVAPLGDINDTLAFTTSSPSAPFTGRLAGANGFESPTAEVIWSCAPSGVSYKGTPLYNLYRRQLLVAATPEAGDFASNVFASVGDSDLSYGSHANSLSDLSKPANRSGASPQDKDLVLGNVVAFDVKIVQPTAISATDDTFETLYDGPSTQPLRGIVVHIRCLEPSNGQVRELQVVQSFNAL